MWQTMIIGLCVAVCLLYVARRLYRIARGRGCACGTRTPGCPGHCPGCTRDCPGRQPSPGDQPGARRARPVPPGASEKDEQSAPEERAARTFTGKSSASGHEGGPGSSSR